MNSGGLILPEKLFYDGNLAIGNTLHKQIEKEENLYQIRKDILAFEHNLNTRRLNYRQNEEDVDFHEKNIKQEITNFKTNTCISILKIQQETEKLIQLEEAVSNTLKHIKQKIKKNSKFIEEEREKINDTQNFEIAAEQYNEILQEQNRNLKNDLIFNNTEYQIKAQITWYSNELQFLDSKISRITLKLPSFDSEKRLVTDKKNKKINSIEQLNENKKQIMKSYPQKDDIELNQKKVIQLQRESKRVLNIVREYHEIQKNLVSRISYTTTKIVRCDILIKKYEKFINELKKKEVSNNCFMFNKMFIDDDNERSGQILKNNSKKINCINKSIKEQETSLERQISDTKNAINGHKQTIQFLNQQINECSKQKRLLKTQLSEMQSCSIELDLAHQKIYHKIQKFDNILNNMEKSRIESIEKLTNPKFIAHPLRPYSYEMDQIYNESNMILKINQAKDQIILLKNKINQYEEENKILNQKLKHQRKKIEDIQYKQIAYFTHKSNQLKSLPTEISPIEKLNIKIADIKRKISNKSINISKKRDKIKYKLTVINNIQKYLQENKKISSNESIFIKKQKKYLPSSLSMKDLQNWIQTIENETLKWEVAKIDDSIQCYLNNWDQELSLPNSDYSYSGISE